MSGLHPKKTLVPIDFSDRSFEALDRALEIAGEGAVLVVHVLVELATMEPGNLYGTISDESRIESVEKHMRKRLSDDKYSAVTVRAKVGDPGREITTLAELEGVDLIVMSSHGYGFIKHMLLGSVAERVVRLAHCPVLVLRS